MSDRYDLQATRIIEQHCRMVEVSTGVHEELRVAIAEALRDAWNDGVRDAPKVKAMADEIVKTLSGTRAICSRCGGKSRPDDVGG